MISAKEWTGITRTHIVGFDNNTHFLQADALSALLKMRELASQSNIDIQVCSSFRSFDKQLNIWNKKWRGELPLNTLDGQQLDAANLSDNEKIHAIMLWSALPGASRHHWGTDFDIYDKAEVARRHHDFKLIPEEYINNGPCALLNDWIEEHANAFDFYLPYARYSGGVAREPWHLSYAPLAKTIEQELNIEVLYETLTQADILGKQSILPLLPELLKRYTLNQGLVRS